MNCNLIARRCAPVLRVNIGLGCCSAACLFLLFASSPAHSQNRVWVPPDKIPNTANSESEPNRPDQPGGDGASVAPNQDQTWAARAMAAQAARKQQQIVTDMSKLLEMVQELKAEMDKSLAGTVPPPVAKKAEDMEKLAKSVRDKIKSQPPEMPGSRN